MAEEYRRRVERISIEANGFVFDALTDGPTGSSGAGELVLLLHGFPESMHEWTDVLPRLATAGYRAVAPNQRGYSPGARPVRLDDYHVSQLREEFMDYCDTMNLDAILEPVKS